MTSHLDEIGDPGTHAIAAAWARRADDLRVAARTHDKETVLTAPHLQECMREIANATQALAEATMRYSVAIAAYGVRLEELTEEQEAGDAAGSGEG